MARPQQLFPKSLPHRIAIARNLGLEPHRIRRYGLHWPMTTLAFKVMLNGVLRARRKAAE